MRTLSDQILATRLLLMMMLSLAVASCASPTPKPVDPTMAASEPAVEETATSDTGREAVRVPLVGLTALEPDVGVTSEDADVEDIGVGDERRLAEGDQVVVGSQGRALLEAYLAEVLDPAAADLNAAGQNEPWLTGDLLPETTLSVEELSNDPLALLLRSNGGIARYAKVGSEATGVELRMLLGPGIGEISAATAPTDFAVCFQAPSGTSVGSSASPDAPIVWIAVVEGDLELTVARDPVVEPAAVPLMAGDIAAVTGAGDISLAEEGIDAIESWYERAVAGERSCFGGGLPSIARRTATAAALLTSEAATPVAGPSGKLTADDNRLSFGDCTTLRWTVKNAMLASLDGEGVALSGTREVCPEETTRYTLKWSGLTGVSGQTAVTIEVVGAPTRDVSREEEEEEEDERAEPDATDTECIPCKRPTRRPSATMAPLPTRQPTQVVEPTVAPPTEPPPTEVPATRPPTEPPATAPPTEPPATQPPATQPPPTDVPEPTDKP